MSLISDFMNGFIKPIKDICEGIVAIGSDLLPDYTTIEADNNVLHDLSRMLDIRKMKDNIPDTAVNTIFTNTLKLLHSKNIQHLKRKNFDATGYTSALLDVLEDHDRNTLIAFFEDYMLRYIMRHPLTYKGKELMYYEDVTTGYLEYMLVDENESGLPYKPLTRDAISLMGLSDLYHLYRYITACKDSDLQNIKLYSKINQK